MMSRSLSFMVVVALYGCGTTEPEPVPNGTGPSLGSEGTATDRSPADVRPGDLAREAHQLKSGPLRAKPAPTLGADGEPVKRWTQPGYDACESAYTLNVALTENALAAYRANPNLKTGDARDTAAPEVPPKAEFMKACSALPEMLRSCLDLAFKYENVAACESAEAEYQSQHPEQQP